MAAYAWCVVVLLCVVVGCVCVWGTGKTRNKEMGNGGNNGKQEMKNGHFPS